MTRFPQSTKSSRPISELMSRPDSSLSKLVKHANYLAQLETVIRGFLSPDMAAQFQVASARKNRLILISPTASWATRLRMHTPQLINSLRAVGFTEVDKIDIRVAPLVHPEPRSRSRRKLSSAAKNALDHMAQLTDDDKD